MTSDSAAMILTCPECATSYFAGDSAIGEGRMVRCSACGASWRAEPERPLELKVDPEAGAIAAEPAAAAPELTGTEDAIRADERLTDEQRAALIAVYRSMAG